jgi:hypothetical protein
MGYINFIHWILLLFYNVHTLIGPTPTLRRKKNISHTKKRSLWKENKSEGTLGWLCISSFENHFLDTAHCPRAPPSKLALLPTFSETRICSCIVHLQNVLRGRAYVSADDSEKVNHLAPLRPHENSTRNKWSVRKLSYRGRRLKEILTFKNRASYI